jgi:hypothetical protein
MSHKELEQASDVVFTIAKVLAGLAVAAQVIDEALEDYERKRVKNDKVQKAK